MVASFTRPSPTERLAAARRRLREERATVLHCLDDIRHSARELICLGIEPEGAPASLVRRIEGASFAIRRRVNRPALYALSEKHARFMLATGLDYLARARAAYRFAWVDLRFLERLSKDTRAEQLLTALSVAAE